MLISDTIKIGTKLLEIRTGKNLTQAQVAELADISDRTYADIERGNANMRAGTLISICRALNITPDDILTEEDINQPGIEELIMRLESCGSHEKQTAAKLLDVYLSSLGK